MADADTALHVDPICGMTVDPATARGGSFDFEGTTYYFCSAGCREKFAAHPFLPSGDTRAKRAMPAAAAVIGRAAAYVCPMHPEIRSAKPGDCPICGMALEPDVAAASSGEDPELVSMTRRFWIACALSVPLLVLAMSGGRGIARLIPMNARPWVELILATPVCLWAGWPLLVRGARSVMTRNLNMFTLIGLGVSVAFIASVAAVLAPSVFPDTFRDEMGHVPLYFEAAAVIVAFVLLGQVLELRARHRTGSAIRLLLDLSPANARRLRGDGTEHDVPLSDVRVGDRLRVRPGQKVPVDGVVLEGASQVDEAMVTGESIPIHKQPGDSVIGATMNGTGGFVMRAERVGAETLLARIVAMVAEAQRSRAPIQKLADRVSGYFVPAVIAVAVAAFAAWLLWGPEPRLGHGLVSAVAVLIIACPCALGLATPMSIMVASGKAATHGVLFRNAEALELLDTIDTVVVDKTGTVTQGKPELATVSWCEPFSETEVLRLAASVERGSEHPIAPAIVRAAESRGLKLESPERFQSFTGRGVTGRVGQHEIAVGNQTLMKKVRASDPDLERKAEKLRFDGQTVVFVAVDGRPAGLLGVADPIKTSAADAIRTLKSDGVRLVMLSGDSKTTAHAVARRLAIDDVRAEVLPNEKAIIIRDLQTDGHRVAMAGDGVNDAPALAAATVGIAMGTGADVAMATAAVTLVKGDLRGIVRARRLSRLTMRNIRQNLFFAFVYNALGVPVAAGLLYPTFGLVLSPMIAAAAMSFSSVSVIANALRLRRATIS